MAKYSDIKGFTVQTVSSDPVASGIAGATWSSISSVNTQRSSLSSGGTTTAGIIAGGYDGTGYPSGYKALTEEWDGSSWTEVADMNSNRSTRGFGTQTSLIAGAGNRGVSSPPTAPGYQNLVESWNGSAWTEVAEQNSNLSSRGTAGQSGTAGIVFGGITPTSGGSPNSVVTESWNGSSWTEVNDLNSARYNLSINAGTYTSALGVGGIFPSPTRPGDDVESWNGSSWTEVAEINTARFDNGASGTGNTSLLVFGGETPAPGVVANTESWDGSSWTERNDLSTARMGGGASGTSAPSAIYASGRSTPSDRTTAAEEFSVAGATASLQVEGQLFFNSTTNTFKETVTDIPGTTWTSGTNLPQALYENAGAGASNTAAMNFGGQGNSPGPAHPHTADTQTYDGSNWTEVNNLNNSRRFLMGAGTTTSALGFGGYTVPPAGPGTQVYTEQWDGTNWTEVSDLNTKRSDNQGIGISNSNALCAAGHEGTAVSSSVENWNGSSWTEVAEKNSIRYRCAATGSNTAGIISGGEVPSTAASALTESWNGSSWTEVADLNTARQSASGGGTSTEFLVVGGYSPPGLKANTELYNGTSWTELNDLSTARYINYGAAGDTGSSLMVFGGGAPSRSDSTEEWTSGLGNKTITAS